MLRTKSHFKRQQARIDLSVMVEFLIKKQIFREQETREHFLRDFKTTTYFLVGRFLSWNERIVSNLFLCRVHNSVML